MKTTIYLCIFLIIISAMAIGDKNAIVDEEQSVNRMNCFICHLQGVRQDEA